MSRPGFVNTLGAYIRLARLSNSPTCLSNVLVGVSIGLAGTNAAVPWIDVTIMTLAIVMLYVGGMVMNDAADAPIDARERPGRPIPAGAVPRRHAFIVAAVALAAGVSIVTMTGLIAGTYALALALAIVAYNALHKRVAAALVLMGVCRALVYITAAAVIARPIDWSIAAPLAIGLGAYITLVTAVARGEASGGTPAVDRRLAMLIIPLAVLPVAFVFPQQVEAMMIAGLLLIGWLIWTQRHVFVTPPDLKRAVVAWLAGICLVDAFYLTVLDRPGLAAVAVACFAITRLWQRVVIGT